jgi:hypothetical protein
VFCIGPPCCCHNCGWGGTCVTEQHEGLCNHARLHCWLYRIVLTCPLQVCAVGSQLHGEWYAAANCMFCCVCAVLCCFVRDSWMVVVHPLCHPRGLLLLCMLTSIQCIIEQR